MALIQEKVILAGLTSWLVGGTADFFAAPTTLDEVFQAVSWARQNQKAISILGGGTNVLVSDSGVRGLVLSLRKLSGVESALRDGRLHIIAMAGAAKSELLKIFLKHQLTPALFLAGLPGDVGGGVAMNAGVGEAILPREFVELVDWIEVLPLDALQADTHKLASSVRRLTKDELTWGYRKCTGWQPGAILRVGLSWPLNPIADLLTQVKKANQVRMSKQPLHLPSCGSVFVNPPGHKAGALIDQSGLRGFQIGGAQVSEKHANFIVNVGGAKATDVDQVIAHIRRTVLAKQGVDLHTEVVYMGDWPTR